MIHAESTTSAPPQPAPVLISVYDRKEHLQRCIEALKKNPEASQTTLYIVSDGWKHEGHRKAIEEVREYINTITGFKEVHARFRETNWGMKASAPEAVEWVLTDHDRLIRMEDDIICSPHYLDFMNETLHVFKNDPRIFGICAHTHPKFKPPHNYPHEIHLWSSFSTWGFATWRDRWLRFITESEFEHLRLQERKLWNRFRKNRPILGTQKIYTQGGLHLDARLNLHVFLTGCYAVFPNQTLTSNAGMDGSGTHCGGGLTYARQRLNPNPVRIDPTIEPCPNIQKKLHKAHYSFLNHGLGSVMRNAGIFDPLYNLYRKLNRIFMSTRIPK